MHIKIKVTHLEIKLNIHVLAKSTGVVISIGPCIAKSLEKNETFRLPFLPFFVDRNAHVQTKMQITGKKTSSVINFKHEAVNLNKYYYYSIQLPPIQGYFQEVCL